MYIIACNVCEYKYLSQSLASVHISVRRFANWVQLGWFNIIMHRRCELWMNLKWLFRFVKTLNRNTDVDSVFALQQQQVLLYTRDTFDPTMQLLMFKKRNWKYLLKSFLLEILFEFFVKILLLNFFLIFLNFFLWNFFELSFLHFFYFF